MKAKFLSYVLLSLVLSYVCGGCIADEDRDCQDVCRNYYSSEYINPVKRTAVEAKTLTVQVPVVQTSVSKDNNDLAVFSGEKLTYLATAGEPDIPFQVVSVLLPPKADLQDIQVSVKNAAYETISGTYTVQPAAAGMTYCNNQRLIIRPQGMDKIEGKNVNVYQADSMFPEDIIHKQNIKPGVLRNWKIVDIPAALYQYNPVMRQLRKVTSLELVVRYYNKKQDSNAHLRPGMDDMLVDEIGRKKIISYVVNYHSAARGYKSLNLKKTSGLSTKNDIKNGYAILTTDYIKMNSRELNNFIEHKEKRGFAVHVITEDQWGGGIGDAAAENIRSWLKGNYMRLGLEYVLLIGDPSPESGDVPMKMLYPRKNSQCYKKYSEAPSDLYYAELSGNWDLDGDGSYGEWSCSDKNTGDFGPGGVDNYTEVAVGRLPFYKATDISELDVIFRRIIDYTNEPQQEADWRNSVLIPITEEGSSANYVLGEIIKDNVLVPKNWEYHRIYDVSENLIPAPETVPCTKENVIDVWNKKDFGMVVWFTHGTATQADYVMDINSVNNLHDNKPVLIFQVSCLNSTPENVNNLSFELLKKNAVSVVGATRVSWYNFNEYVTSSYNTRLAYEYANNVVSYEMNTGHAHQKMIRELAPHSASTWMNILVYNNYGDPEVGLYTSVKK